MPLSFIDEIGGKDCIKRVHKILYDKLLSHPWLKGFFVGVERWVLEDQQTDFMADLFGQKPAGFCGRLPMRAHQHLYITEEVFMIRHNLLAESLTEAKIPDDYKERWLKHDLGMMAAIVKTSVDECEGRYRTEKVLVVPKPA
ncbi:MAG: group 1 truncated hemoglobin [Rhodospirillaceae bacterium]|nr:group 1 truncated hemoglobin [Rhodospirillaceae bacterium]